MTTHQYQKKCHREYTDSIKFPKENSYLYGNPVGTVVPIETAIGKVMVIGPLPSPRVYFVNAIPDVPLTDGTAPFSIEPYFDGSRVRSSYTGQELSDIILETLEIQRRHCWLTSLVKVFLFDDDHVKKYHRLGKEIKANRSEYMDYANKSLKWIRQEIEIANPYAIILLGEQVISSLLLISEKEAREQMTGKVIEKKIIWKNSNFICLPPPGVLMDRSAKNPWPRKFALQIGPTAMKELERLRSQPSI
ncbi:MAG: uracil-DNA glycosylase family protein [Bacteroidota bacterium]